MISPFDLVVSSTAIIAGCYSNSRWNTRLAIQGVTLDIQGIVRELKRERDRLELAITALDPTDSAPASLMSSPAAKNPAPSTGRGHHLTPEGRKRLSQNMKQRWAEKRKKASRGRK